ncbi:ABC transporter permease [Crassaminicella profunda]|uniref:ABC transporter permease n=1 Tax=Crassaminicella profunda TaxID=1286698 RepID=UPI001CA6472C|nr:ABC transporter permease [Crassaminicella profunda]QZY53866.1 ABC transporter permease [Crassaminicella profunda]
MENPKQLKMKIFLIKRIVSLLLVLIGITMLCFFLLSLSPIDAADAYIHKHMMWPTEETVKKIQEELGLNQPLYKRYIDWLKNAVTLNFGNSFVTGKPIVEEITICFKRTLNIVFGTVFIMLLVSIPLGILSATYKNKRIDSIIRVISLMGMSMPSYWVGFMLIYLFSIKLNVLPFIFKDHFNCYVLPSITLSIPFFATYTRMVRTNILNQLEEDFVIYSRARGIPFYKIMMKHILKSSSVSLIALLGQNIGNILVGTAIIETVFSIKGLGRYGIDAIFSRDHPAINAYVIIIAFSFSLVNIVADLIAMKIDKRVGENSLL